LCYFRSTQPPEDSKYLFFLEEAYDGFTVPKNIKNPMKLMDIVDCFIEARDIMFIDLGFMRNSLDISGDYISPYI
jgi:hypothetical protein